MRKLFSNGLVVIAGVVSLPIPGTHADAKAPAAEHRDQPQRDPRLARLRKFFQRSQCPAADHSPAFLAAADANELDWRLLPSISFVESTGGKAARNNNIFGWDSGHAGYSSMDACIHSVAFSLANSILYRDKDVDGILRTYNPDAEYAGKVKSVMRRIAPKEDVD